MLNEKAKNEAVETVEFFLRKANEIGVFELNCDDGQIIQIADLMLRQYTAEMEYWNPNDEDVNEVTDDENLPSEDESISIIRRAAKCLLDSDTPLADDDREGLEEQAIAMLKRVYGKRPADMTYPQNDYWCKSTHDFEDGTIIEVIVTIPAEENTDA